MSWRIEDHPEGGMMIRHLARPRFAARWTTGEFPLEAMCEGVPVHGYETARRA